MSQRAFHATSASQHESLISQPRHRKTGQFSQRCHRTSEASDASGPSHSERAFVSRLCRVCDVHGSQAVLVRDIAVIQQGE